MLGRTRFLTTAITAASSVTSSLLATPATAASDAGQRHFSQPGLEGLRIAAYDTAAGSSDSVLAIGHVVAQLSDVIFAVDFRERALPPVEVGSRVYVEYENAAKSGAEAQSPVLMGGLVIKANLNGTLTVLLDSHKIDLAVPRERVVREEAPGKFLTRRAYNEVLEWVRTAGVATAEEQVSVACVLYKQGWRAHRLYLLEAGDVAQLVHLNKSTRMSLLEKAEWQRDHHRQMRSIYKERVKEKDKRYLFSKYAGILSASVAFVGAFSLFGWNYKNYLKQQRYYQMRFAVASLTAHNPTHGGLRSRLPLISTASHESTQDEKMLPREREERWLRQVFQKLDTAHPRIIVLTGYAGCGKSSVCRAAIEKEGMPALYVDVRNKEDPLRSIIKAMGVLNVEACGDPLDFIAEACQQAKSLLPAHQVPMLVIKMRDGDSLTRFYNEAVTLACDRLMCHLVLEVPLESLTMANTSLPRLDFYTVPNFTPAQAYEYTQHSIDPVSLAHFIDVAGTNSNDLDELFAAVHQRRVSAMEYTNQKMLKAMRQLQSAWAGNEELRTAVRHLARFPFETGQHTGIDVTSLHSTALRDIALYDSVRDVWLFKNKIFHTAARCCRGEEVS